MATMLHAESRRMYSWWWDSHISPKNSKWLQENLTDMDTKVKAMIKLIEEDADSFARRAEMYYKKRPELLKLVEEFYRAYRALAERYDHATGALRQAHRTMAEAFPNQIPLLLPDDSPSNSSVSDVEPHTPDIPTPIHALFEPDDLHKDALGMPSYCHAIQRSGPFSEENNGMSRKGLKQLNEMFATGEGAARAKLADDKVRKGLNFRENEGKSLEHKMPDGSKEHIDDSGDKEVADKEIKHLQEEVLRLSKEVQNLKSQITSESERAIKAQTEIGTLNETLSQLKSEKEAALFQCQLSAERILDLETEMSSTQHHFRRLNNEMIKDVAKLNDAEERCLLLEKSNQSLQLDLESIEQKARSHKYELDQKLDEFEKVKLSLESIEKLHSQSQENVKHLSLEIQSRAEKLKGVELTNRSLVEEVNQLKEQNSNLYEQTTQKMKNLQDEIILLKEGKRELEEEVGFLVKEKKVLHQELCHQKEDRDDLEQKHRDLIEQMNVVSSNVGFLQVLMEELRDGNAKLKETCKKYEEEKVLHLKNLENMESISEKNAVLESSLLDANVELEVLRQQINLVEESYEFLCGQLVMNVSEKAMLVSLLEISSQDMEKLSDRNTLLENSLFDVNVRLEALRMKLKCLEESSYQSLDDEKSNLFSENSTLVSQVESSALNIKKLSEENAFLEKSLFERGVLLKGRSAKLKDSEEFCWSLYDEKARHLGEINTLASQVEVFAQHIEKLLDKNAFLEKSLSNRDIELEAHRVKVKDLEESFQYLCDEKANLHAEKNNLISQLEAAAQSMENLSENNASLEKSLFDINVEMKELRARLTGLEEAYQLVCDIEMKELRARLTGLEEAYQLVCDEMSNLLVEKNSLVCQVETTAQYSEKLSEKNAFLEKSLSDANIKLETLGANLKRSEELSQLLCNEKSSLLAEKDTLVSQVESITQILENLENKYAELEDKHLNLASEEVLTLNQLMELQECLKVEKLEHETLIHSSKFQLAGLENQIRLLQEAVQLREEELEGEQQRNINLQTESFILQKCIHDMKEMNLILCVESQKHLKASRDAEELISVFKQESQAQKIRLASLIEQNEKLRDGISVLSRALNVNMDYGSSGGFRDEVLLQTILNKIRNLLNSISGAQDENQQLTVDKAIVLAILQQSMLDMADLRAEKSLLDQKFQIRTKELLVLHSKQDELQKINQQLGEDLQASFERENALKAEIEILSGQIFDLQEAHVTLQKKICELVEENQSLSKKIYDLGHKKEAMEAKNNIIIEEAMTLELLYLIFRNLSDERASELILFSNDVDYLHGLNNDLNQGIRNLDQKMEALHKENFHMKKLNVFLEQRVCQFRTLEDDLNRALDQCEQLQIEVQNRKQLLMKKDLELSEANWKMQEAHQTSQGEISKLIKQKQSLSEELCNLQEKKDEIEEENIAILAEVMTLECLHLFFRNLSAERTLELESFSNNVDRVLCQNNDLYQQIGVLSKKIRVLEVDCMHMKKSVVSLEGAHQTSQSEIRKLTEENQSLSRELYKVKDQKDVVEEENCIALMEALSVECLYLYFRNFSAEKQLEVQLLGNDIDHLYQLKNGLVEDIRVINGRVELLEAENMHFKESVVCLENELKTARNICEQLNFQVENGKNLLINKDLELLQTNQMLQSTQEKNSEYCRELEHLKMEIDKAKSFREELEKNVLTLSEGISHREKEITYLNEAQGMLEGELHKLHKEVHMLGSREEYLTFKLQKGMHELEQCEEEITALLQDIQISTVNAAFFEEKVLELTLDCEGLLIIAVVQQEKLYEEINARNAYADNMKRKLDDLEGENIGLKDKLNAFLPLVISLSNSVNSLEEHTLSLAKIWTLKNLEEQDNYSVSSAHEGSHEELKEDHSSSVEPTVVSHMKKMLTKLEALQKVVVRTCNILEKERLQSSANLETVVRRKESFTDQKPQKDDAEIPKMNHGQMMKDIQLDQVSSSSLHGSGILLYGPNKIEIAETDDQMLVLWETAESNCNNQIRKTSSVANEHDIEYHEIEAVEEEKSEYPSSELMAEKELGIDKLEWPKITAESHEEWKAKVIERLASDAQRLSALQTGIQELKEKMESSEKHRTPLSIEYNKIKAQLKEAEGTILQLVDFNSTLTRKAEDYSVSSSSLVGGKEEMGKPGRRQLSERARRGSEKIGNLELELHKIHYILLKLEEEHDSRVKVMQRRSSILLRDYLYGKRESHRRKKGVFCGCLRPKTEA